jgi:hypothetical protein
MLSRAGGRTDDEIPSEPGLCFPGGFLSRKASDQEDISAGFMLSNMHDVSFSLSTDSSISETTTLLQRGADINEALSHNEGRTLRKGSVDVPGMHSEEWLMAG